MPAATRVATSSPDQYVLYNFANIATNAWLNSKTGDSDFGPFPGNMTGRDAFRTPGTWDLDLGIYKVVRFTESKSLQLRLEAYNADNQANFSVNTGSAVISGGAGTITGTYGPPFPGCSQTSTTCNYLGNRDVQLGAKFIF